MYNDSTHSPLDPAIQYPSVPDSLAQMLLSSPADSFSLFPSIDMGMLSPADPDAPLAPAIPVFSNLRGGGIIVDWKIVRCPYCGDTHVHSGTDGEDDDKDHALRRALINLGGRYVNCTKKVSEDHWSSEYQLIGVTKAPNKRELDKYFPMVGTATGDPVGGGVYLIESAGRYKIGCSGKPSNRINDLRTACPYPIVIVYVAYTEDYKNLEKALHRRFKEFNTHGEWFDLPDFLLDQVIAEMKDGEV